MVSMNMVVQSLLGDHCLVTNVAGVLKSPRVVNILYVVHQVVFLGSSFATQSAHEVTAFW